MARAVRRGLALTGGISALVAACAAEPAMVRTKTTLGEVDLTGLECRDEAVLGSLRKRTICASSEQWVGYDERKREALEDIKREMDSVGNSFFIP